MVLAGNSVSECVARADDPNPVIDKGVVAARDLHLFTIAMGDNVSGAGSIAMMPYCSRQSGVCFLSTRLDRR